MTRVEDASDNAHSGSDGGGGASHEVKLTGGGKRKIGNMAEDKDMVGRDVLKKRGGNASVTKNVNCGDWWDKKMGEIANTAVSGNQEAETVMKQIKQAGSKSQKYGGE